MGNQETEAIVKCRRADALKNEEKLVIEAKKAFAEKGTDASLEEIARNAGVGIGTLYRHFPTRRHLIEAVIEKSVRHVVEFGESLRGSDDPRAALEEWIRMTVKKTMIFRGLAESFCQSVEGSVCGELQEVGAGLLVECQQAGVVRDDVTVHDLTMMVNALAWTSEQQSNASFDTMLSVMLDGLSAIPA